MKDIRSMIWRAIAIAAFTGLTMGGTAMVAGANSGHGTHSYGTQPVEEGTGSGTGGAVDTGNPSDSNYNQKGSDRQDNYRNDKGINDVTGPDQAWKPGTNGRSRGTGTGGSTGSEDTDRSSGSGSQDSGETEGR